MVLLYKDAVKKRRLFEIVGSPAASCYAEPMTLQNYKAGDVVYTQGSLADGMYIIQSGCINLERNGDVIRTLSSGQSFGELALIQSSQHLETAVAVEDTSLRLLTETEVESLVYSAPDEIQKMFVGIAHADQSAHVSSGNSNHAINALAGSVERVTSLLHTRIDQLQKQVGVFHETSQEHNDGESGTIHALTPDFVSSIPEMAPIADILEDETVNDVLINGAQHVYVERSGLLEEVDIKFSGENAVQKIADKIVELVGRKIDRKRPMIDARLLDGSRVNIIEPPLSIDGTSISIRKFSKRKLTLDYMKQNNNVSEALGEFLKIIGHCRLNIIISGGTGSGKTTLLNAISQHIDMRERIITIEDAAELKLNQPHVVRLETKPISAGANRDEEVTIRDLVKNALRMRPDRIIVGEVRGAEAFDMMQAMNTGHEGSLTTIHANHPRDALSRLENMVSMANLNIPMKSLRYQIASAIHLIVQVSRMRDGQRRVTHISEVVGMEGDVVSMHDLFVFNVDGEDEKGKIRGHFKWSGILPRFIRRIQYYGEGERLEKALNIKLSK